MELQSKEWLGKGKYMLSAANVRAFLCDTATCRNLGADKSYVFATAGNVDSGGGVFTTDAFGRGPGDAVAWSSSLQFGVSALHWSNRRTVTSTTWSIGPQDSSMANTCNNWSVANGAGAVTVGTTSRNGQERWSDPNSYAITCNTEQRLICIVD
jgi:hypothetical protein